MGGVSVWEVTSFNVACSSDGCVSFPEQKGDMYMTSVNVVNTLPYLSQITFIYPAELADGSSFFTFTGMLEQPGNTAKADFVLTGGPPGYTLSGSLSADADVSGFPVITFNGPMVICGLEDNLLSLE